MNALVRKEIRLLLPAWITALLLVLAPLLLGQLIDGNEPAGVINRLTMFGVAIGGIVLGLAGIGRELASHTFSMILAQPRPRGELWRAKLSVLIVSLIPIALFLGLVSLRFFRSEERADVALTWLLTVCVAVTGGLWTTLLFRQIIAAFWISLLLPLAILFPIVSLGDEVAEETTRNYIATVLLVAYSIAGYLFARWQFRHTQDTAWTGGVVSLPSVDRWLPWKRPETVRSKMHPLRALLGKEFHFQQVSFLLAGLLLLLQIMVLLIQKFVTLNENSVLATIVQMFWGIWIVMPLVVGCSAVAEERKLGTHEPQICLPVSCTWQFSVKVFVTLICSILLGAVVPVLVEVINPGRESHSLDFAGGWTLACLCLTVIAFYASSLTQQLLQSFGTAIGMIVVGGFLANWFMGSFSRGHNSFSLFGVNLWQGPLVLLIGAGVMLLFAAGHTWRRLRWLWLGLAALTALLLSKGKLLSLLDGGLATTTDGGFKAITLLGMAAALCPVALTLALAANNFKHTRISRAIWRRNAAIWLGCFALTGVLTALAYNRVWELAMTFEPPAGAPRLSGPVQPAIARIVVDRPTLVLLPDGRLCSYQAYERVPRADSTQTNSEPGWRPTENPRVEFVGGSNWVAIATTSREAVGVKADGSLWSAPWFKQVDAQGNIAPFHWGSVQKKGSTISPTELKFGRVGSESAWVTVAASWQHCVALKRDGTIWGWGDNWNQQLSDGPKFVTNAPMQISQATNWIAVYAGNGYSYAVNRQQEIWKWGKFTAYNGDPFHRKSEDGPVKLNIKVSGVRDVSAGNIDLDLVLDAEGNLWGLGSLPPALSGEGFNTRFFSEPKRLSGANWSAVSYDWHALIGLKADGALWLQRSRDPYNLPLPKLAQLGQRTDWIAVRPDWEADFALAKDGTLCRFGNQTLFERMELLAPTRRVTWSINLLDATK